MSKPDGGPAFPGEKSGYWCNQCGGPVEHRPGMTLRDYFAAKAMLGYLNGVALDHAPWPAIESVARKAYEVADAMLKEREKP